MKVWIIQTWTGRNMYPGKTFKTFEDGWEFVYAHHPDEEEYQDIYVVEVEED